MFVINIRTGYCTASQVSTLNKFSEIFSALDALVSDSVLGRLVDTVRYVELVVMVV